MRDFAQLSISGTTGSNPFHSSLGLLATILSPSPCHFQLPIPLGSLFDTLRRRDFHMRTARKTRGHLHSYLHSFTFHKTNYMY